jgi:hypothetical protein
MITFFAKSRVATAFSMGALATALMTGFSYLLSNLFKEQFREPQLLSYLFVESLTHKKESPPPLLAYLMHFIVGWVFALFFEFVWRPNVQLRPLKNGLAFGSLCGIVGIGVWKTTFALHPDPPKTRIRPYLLHLMLAHLIFGTTLSEGSSRIKQ